MATVKLTGFDRITQSWDNLIKRFQSEKREKLREVGQKALGEVGRNIGGTGKVSGWQAPHMGSGGGYVAVRPRSKTHQTTKNGRRYAVGYITNAIEGGHRTGGQRPGPKAQGYKYRPRFNKAAVPGRWFYEKTRGTAERILRDSTEDLQETIVDGLEGRL